jgi:hypothetical protein
MAEMELKAFVRNHYFQGRLLSAADLQLEQDYHNKKRWLSNRLLLGAGVVTGLEVSSDKNDNSKIQISPGLAIDPIGREIVVPENEIVLLPVGWLKNPLKPTTLYLCYDEKREGVRVLPTGEEYSEGTEPGRTKETYRFQWQLEASLFKKGLKNKFTDEEEWSVTLVKSPRSFFACIPIASIKAVKPLARKPKNPKVILKIDLSVRRTIKAPGLK